MATRRPPHLADGCYVGFNRYLLTICSANRLPVICSPPASDIVTMQLLQSASRFGFAVVVYCAMPDHIHVLVEAETSTADALAFVKHFKQLSSFAYKRVAGHVLWQEGFYDRILREDEDLMSAAEYVLFNRVRKNLVTDPRNWPHLGSGRYNAREMLETIVRSRV